MPDNGHTAIGSNSNLNKDEKQKLGLYIEEIERVAAKIDELASERSLIYKTAKEAGFHTNAIKHQIKLRRMEKEERNAFESACDAYALALGDFATTELGRASAPRPAA